MQIIVASSNIFRRELTSYVLDEAGYSVEAVSTLEDLTATLVSESPLAIVLDPQCAGFPMSHTFDVVRAHSMVPVLWLADRAAVASLLDGDERPMDALAWPYEAEDLRARLALLLFRVTEAGGRARFVGGAE